MNIIGNLGSFFHPYIFYNCYKIPLMYFSRCYYINNKWDSYKNLFLLISGSRVRIPKGVPKAFPFIRKRFFRLYRIETYPHPYIPTRHYHKLPFIFFTIFLLHNSWVPSAQQLMGICTTPDMRAHNSCCAVGDINLSKNRHYIFRQLLLLL